MTTREIVPTDLLRPIALPRHHIQQRFRPAKKNIPQTPAERNRMLQFIRHYVAEYNPVPPLPIEQLKEHADRVLEMRLLPLTYESAPAQVVSVFGDFLAIFAVLSYVSFNLHASAAQVTLISVSFMIPFAVILRSQRSSRWAARRPRP